jgi:hypothetical protein
LTPLVLCCGLPAIFFAGLFSSLRGSEPYRTALELANSDSRVLSELGQPVTGGFMVFGSIKKNVAIQNGSSTADEAITLSIPVSGPKGSGTIEVEAAKSGGKWTYSKMLVLVPSRKTPLDLLVPH